MLEFCSTNFHCDFTAAVLPFGFAFGFMSHSHNQASALCTGHLMPRLYSEETHTFAPFHLLLEELKVLNMLCDFKDSFLAEINSEHICHQSIRRTSVCIGTHSCKYVWLFKSSVCFERCKENVFPGWFVHSSPQACAHAFFSGYHQKCG